MGGFNYRELQMFGICVTFMVHPWLFSQGYVDLRSPNPTIPTVVYGESPFPAPYYTNSCIRGGPILLF